MPSGKSSENLSIPAESDEFAPRAIETAADLGAKALFRQDVWKRVCAGDGQCRADLVKRAVAASLRLAPDERREYEASDEYKQADTRFVERAGVSVAGKATFRGAVILDRDPLRERKLTPLTDPLRIDAPSVEVAFDGLETMLGRGFQLLFDDQDGLAFREALTALGEPKMGKALESWATSWATRPWAQSAGVLDRCLLLKDLFPDKAPPACVWGEEAWRSPEASAAGASESAALRSFESHCGDCHESGGSTRLRRRRCADGAAVPQLGALHRESARLELARRSSDAAHGARSDRPFRR